MLCHSDTGGMTVLTITSKKSPVQSEGQDVHRDMKSLASDVPARFFVKLET